MDHYAGGWNVLVLALCECIAIAYVYGKSHIIILILNIVENLNWQLLQLHILLKSAPPVRVTRSMWEPKHFFRVPEI